MRESLFTLSQSDSSDAVYEMSYGARNCTANTDNVLYGFVFGDQSSSMNENYKLTIYKDGNYYYSWDSSRHGSSPRNGGIYSGDEFEFVEYQSIQLPTGSYQVELDHVGVIGGTVEYDYHANFGYIDLPNNMAITDFADNGNLLGTYQDDQDPINKGRVSFTVLEIPPPTIQLASSVSIPVINGDNASVESPSENFPTNGDSDIYFLWVTSDATSCTATSTDDKWTGSKNIQSGWHYDGPISGLTSGDHIYTLNCSGPGGSSSTSTTVYANPPTIESFDYCTSIVDNTCLVDLPITEGDDITLVWIPHHSSSCTATSSDGTWTGNKSSNYAINTELISNLNPSGDHTYTLSCSRGGESTSTQVTVNVIPIQPTITTFDLYDNPSNGNPIKLSYLSVGNHNYLNNEIRIHGNLVFESQSESTELSNITLDILNNTGSNVVATAHLNQTARTTLIEQPFGTDKMISYTGGDVLFVLSLDESTKFSTSYEETLTLRINATYSTLGDSFTQDYSDTVEKLVKYTANNRYGDRTLDALNCYNSSVLCAGDDWVRPSIRTIAESFTGVVYNDFSNMNAGNFPPHNAHKNGIDVDVKFEGGTNGLFTVNADSAQSLVDYLNNSTYGGFIEKAFVTFASNSEFAQKINEDGNRYLNDGCRTENIIQNVSGHTDHFHWEFSFAPRICQAVIDPVPPTSGDWQIAENTIIRSNIIVPGNLIISNDTELVIASSGSLEIDINNNYLEIESGSNILIKDGGALYLSSNS